MKNYTVLEVLIQRTVVNLKSSIIMLFYKNYAQVWTKHLKKVLVLKSHYLET
jgi:hypothetical protein